MKSFLTSLGVSAALLLASAPAFADAQKDWATVSDIGVAGLSLLSIGLPVAKGDKQGAFQAAGSIGATALVTTTLKASFPELRPDGSDRKSFPSGHTANAFAAAASLYNRQGPKVGVPALLVASLVGVARVKAEKHHWYDAVIGAGIGTTAGFLITRNRREQSVVAIPWGDSKGGGISLAMRF